MSSYPTDPKVEDVRRRIRAAHDASERPTDKAADKLEAQGKLYVRDRIALLVDEGSFVEDGRYANALAAGFDHYLVKPVSPDALLALVHHGVHQFAGVGGREGREALRDLPTDGAVLRDLVFQPWQRRAEAPRRRQMLRMLARGRPHVLVAEAARAALSLRLQRVLERRTKPSAR